MLVNGNRELAYFVEISSVEPIEGYDRIELAHINGWQCVVGKDDFKAGDVGIYFEIDSLLPAKEPFLFLEKRKYKIKTQRFCKGKVLSQGLLMPLKSFVGTSYEKDINKNLLDYQEKKIDNLINIPLTKTLEVIYYEAEDNKRKANSADKYMSMQARHKDLFKKRIFKYLMKKEWGRKILFFFFGKKKDKKGFPSWVTKTDEERIQNIPSALKDKSRYIVTEKVDGSSATFTARREGIFRIPHFYVCSRNVLQDSDSKQCYYDTNIYWEIYKKYNIQETLKDLLSKNPDLDWVTIQGEIYGDKVQKRDYSLKNQRDFAAFNLVYSNRGRVGTEELLQTMLEYQIPTVPILSTDFILPDTVEKMLELADGTSFIDGKPREGLVLRSADGSKSFKAVSNSFLEKYHY